MADGGTEEAVAELVQTGSVMADGLVLRVEKWEVSWGTFPNPQLVKARIRLSGFPLILFDEVGSSFITSPFGAAVEVPVSLITDGINLRLKIGLRVGCVRDIPVVVTVDFDGCRLLVWV